MSSPRACAEGDIVARLIDDARRHEGESLGRLLQSYRNYLTILASSQLSARLRQRVSPSDLVQETMLAGHRDFHQFRGASEREFLAWLRQILINNLHHAVDAHVKTQKRDVRCEVSIDQAALAVDRSADALAGRLVDPGPSPSSALRARERSVALADQLARLKPDYREVIVLRNLKGMSFDEVASQLGRRVGAVRMLWLRAMEKLKDLCERVE